MKTDNELIAEFMGLEQEFEYDVIHYASDRHFHGWISESSYDDVKHLNTTSLEGTRVKQNPYHTSWDWLMPVVEKIGGIGFKIEIITHNQGNDYYHKPTKNSYSCTIHKCYWKDSIFHEDFICGRRDLISLIDVAYRAVLEFIKWYDTQNP